MKSYKFIITALMIIGVCALLGGFLGAKFANNQSEIEQVLKNLSLLLSTIESNYMTEVKSQDLLKASINGFLNGLDPHSNFLDEKNYKQMKEEQHGSFFGLGITLSKLNGMLTVISPIEGTPAYRAGIRAGDIISEVNGQPTKDEAIDVSVSKLRGPKGTKVTITIIREGYNDPMIFTLMRDEIPINSIPYSFMIDEQTGYIKIKSFTETTSDEVIKSLEKLKAQSMKRLVLDFRGNPGGLLEQAVKVADKFLPKRDSGNLYKGPYIRFKSRILQ